MSKLPSVSELIIGAQLPSLHSPNPHSSSSSRSNSDASPRQSTQEVYMNLPSLKPTFPKPPLKAAGVVAYPHARLHFVVPSHEHPGASYHGRDHPTVVSPGGAVYHDSTPAPGGNSEYPLHYTNSYAVSVPALSADWAGHRDGYFPRNYSQSSQSSSSQSSLSSYRGEQLQHPMDALARMPTYSHFATSESMLRLESRSPGMGSPVLPTHSKPGHDFHPVPHVGYATTAIPPVQGPSPYPHQVAFTVPCGGAAGSSGPIASYPHIPVPPPSRTSRHSISGHSKQFAPPAVYPPGPLGSHPHSQGPSPSLLKADVPGQSCCDSAEPNHALINKRYSVKRRTRTGCLTCRKRRIKCDERKPFCTNCERSRKVCLGYEAAKPTRRELRAEQREQENRSSVHNLL